MNKIYLDTNVVADIIDATRKNHAISLKILEYLVIKKYEICISEDMITTLYYILKDKKQTLECFENLIFLDWKILSFGLDTIKKASNLSLEKNIDLEDALQCLCAKENACHTLLTNDKKFYDCGIEILSSIEFLDKYQ
jgi:predicted nucleic acid-binding protein